jgi:hypothetical protein
MTPGNLAAADVDLTDDEFAQIEGELAKEQLQNTGGGTRPHSSTRPDECRRAGNESRLTDPT